MPIIIRERKELLYRYGYLVLAVRKKWGCCFIIGVGRHMFGIEAVLWAFLSTPTFNFNSTWASSTAMT